MTINRRAIVSGFTAAGIGIAGSTGFYVFIALTVLFPALCLVQSSRRAAYVVGLSYYGGSLWPLIPAVRNFFGREATPGIGLLLWSTSTAFLGLPWLWAWSIDHRRAIWRAPLALLFSVVPPLGFIGWASPLLTAGILFPGTRWFGLAAILLLCGTLVSHPKTSWAGVIVGALVVNVCYPGDPAPPNGWEAVDTNFGGLAHEAADPIFAYRVAEWIQNRALSSGSRILIFPEALVPLWTDATDLFWHQTLASLTASGKTILVGAEIPDREQGRQRDQKAIVRCNASRSFPPRFSRSLAAGFSESHTPTGMVGEERLL